MLKRAHATILIPLVLILIFVVLLNDLFGSSSKGLALIDAVSPSEEFVISIYSKRGQGLLNVPTYITVYGDYATTSSPWGELFKIQTHIDNDDAVVTAYGNIRLFWTDDRNVFVILLGAEQEAEIIKISFGDDNGVNIEQTRSSEDARKIWDTRGRQTDTRGRFFCVLGRLTRGELQINPILSV